MSKATDKNWKALAWAIVVTAVRDWHMAQDVLTKYPDDDKAFYMAKECEDFFRSEWYSILQGMNPKEIPEDMISLLKEEG